MNLLPNNLQLIANFLYRHRSEESWWTAPILIDKKELRSLNLSLHDVEKVLKVLEQKGLLKQDGLTGVVRYTLYAFRIYRLDFSRLEELAKFSGVPLWYRWYSKLWADREDGLKTF